MIHVLLYASKYSSTGVVGAWLVDHTSHTCVGELHLEVDRFAHTTSLMTLQSCLRKISERCSIKCKHMKRER